MSNKRIGQPELHPVLRYFLYGRKGDPADNLDRIRGIRKAEERQQERKEKGWSKPRAKAERVFNVKENR